jgi:hypothetical protein
MARKKRLPGGGGPTVLGGNENVDPRAAAGRDPLAARMDSMEQASRKKRAGCFSFLGGGRGRKRKAETSGGVDLGASNIEIPGGLAGIRARMAEMGHHMNAPPPPLGKTDGDEQDEFGADAAPAGPNAPNAHKETMSGDGFVLTSDFCTEDGQQAAVQPRQRRATDAAAKKKSKPAAVASRETRSPPEPEPEPELDILERKNADGSEMSIEQLLNQFGGEPLSSLTKSGSPHVSRRPSANAPSAAPAAPILLGAAAPAQERESLGETTPSLRPPPLGTPIQAWMRSSSMKSRPPPPAPDAEAAGRACAACDTGWLGDDDEFCRKCGVRTRASCSGAGGKVAGGAEDEAAARNKAEDDKMRELPPPSYIEELSPPPYEAVAEIGEATGKQEEAEQEPTPPPPRITPRDAAAAAGREGGSGVETQAAVPPRRLSTAASMPTATAPSSASAAAAKAARPMPFTGPGAGAAGAAGAEDEGTFDLAGGHAPAAGGSLRAGGAPGKSEMPAEPTIPPPARRCPLLAEARAAEMAGGGKATATSRVIANSREEVGACKKSALLLLKLDPIMLNVTTKFSKEAC